VLLVAVAVVEQHQIQMVVLRMVEVELVHLVVVLLTNMVRVD
tara:strand:- start:356 stop:481 length:126 start_codon:yes stop_codon:yes gene_type:complete